MSQKEKERSKDEMKRQIQCKRSEVFLFTGPRRLFPFLTSSSSSAAAVRVFGSTLHFFTVSSDYFLTSSFLFVCLGLQREPTDTRTHTQSVTQA